MTEGPHARSPASSAGRGLRGCLWLLSRSQMSGPDNGLRTGLGEALLPGWAAFGGILSGSEVHTGAAAAEPPPPHTSPSSSQGPWPGPFTQLTLQRMLPPPALLPGAALAYTELPCPGLTPPRGHPEASGWMMREYLSIWDNSKASSRPPGVLEPPVHELLP